MIGVVIFSLASLFCGLAWSEGVLIAVACGAGPRRSGDHAVGALDRDDDLRGRRRAEQGARHLGRARAAAAPRSASSPAASSRRTSAGSGSSSSTSPSARSPSSSRRASCARAVPRDGSRWTSRGAVTVTGGLALLVYAVSKAPDHGWSSGLDAEPARRRRRCSCSRSSASRRATRIRSCRSSIFRIQTVAGANVSGLLLGAIIFANFFLLTLYVQQVLGYSADQDRDDVRRHRGQRSPLGRARAEPDDAVRREAGAGRRVRRDDRRRDLYYTQIPTNGSFVSALLPGYLLIGLRGCRSRSSRSRSPRSRASATTRRGSRRG